MNSNFNQDSFEKGQQFESFVENVLLPKADYDLLHKTSDIDQNELRFVEDSLLPDFRFRCKLTGKVFRIEAKFRSRAYKGEYEIASAKQLSTFPKVETDEVPILCALGYGGNAQDPQFVSLIPFRKFSDGIITTDEAMSYQVPKKAVQPSLIQELTNRPTSKAIADSHDDAFIHNEDDDRGTASNEEILTNKDQPKSSSKTRNILLASVLLVVAALVAFMVWNGSSASEEEILKERIANYYQILDANKVHEIHEYISPNIHTWYSYPDTNLEKVISDIKRYRQKYPFTVSEIDWSNFSLTQLQNGYWEAKYPLDYRIKSKMKNPYKTYDLTITTIWDQNMMLVSATEVKR
jgi:hypothetical protein